MPSYQLGVDAQQFLAEHWQREHLFLPQAMAPFQPPADAGELAGLAMEDGVDARIVDQCDGRWVQHQGPFGAGDFAREGAWSLLVQSVDHYWDEASELSSAVAFIPSWRLDDVMMSYANDGGSVGPHYDNYDVFIVQGEGQRRWQIGGFCDARTPLMPDTDMRLLASFETSAEYVMQQGDVLYIPPGCAHWGTSIGESTSFSIGFRAPRLSDLLARFVDNLLPAVGDDQLYGDPARRPALRAGEISDEDVLAARAQLLRLLEQDDGRWFGEVLTSRNREAADGAGLPDAVRGREAPRLLRSPESGLAWQQRGREILVFAQGHSRPFPAELRPLLEALCAQQAPEAHEALALHAAARDLIDWLLEEGCIEFCE